MKNYKEIIEEVKKIDNNYGEFLEGYFNYINKPYKSFLGEINDNQLQIVIDFGVFKIYLFFILFNISGHYQIEDSDGFSEKEKFLMPEIINLINVAKKVYLS